MHVQLTSSGSLTDVPRLSSNVRLSVAWVLREVGVASVRRSVVQASLGPAPSYSKRLVGEHREPSCELVAAQSREESLQRYAIDCQDVFGGSMLKTQTPGGTHFYNSIRAPGGSSL